MDQNNLKLKDIVIVTVFSIIAIIAMAWQCSIQERAVRTAERAMDSAERAARREF